MQRLVPSLRGLVGSLLLVVGAVLAAFALAEAGVRLLSLDALSEPPAPRPLSAAHRDLPEIRSVAGLGRPGVRGIFRGVLHRTNSRGVRGPEYSGQPPGGTFRVAIVGDSYTMGQGVEEREAYPAVAASILNQRADGVRYEVINLGVAGLAIRHSLRRLERVGLAYEPHLLVVGFTPNDILGDDYRDPAPEDRRAVTALLGRFEDSPLALLRVVWPRGVLALSAFRPIPGTYEHTLEQNYFENPAAWRQVTDAFSKLAELAEARGVCVHVFLHTRMNQLWFHPFTRIYERVAEAARESGLSAHVSYPSFRGHDVAALRLSGADTHPSVAGHRLHAEALLSGLDELPPHCWRPGHFVP